MKKNYFLFLLILLSVSAAFGTGFYYSVKNEASDMIQFLLISPVVTCFFLLLTTSKENIKGAKTQ